MREMVEMVYVTEKVTANLHLKEQKHWWMKDGATTCAVYAKPKSWWEASEGSWRTSYILSLTHAFTPYLLLH